VSQGYQGPFSRKLVEARDGNWGVLAGVAYAEPFIRGEGATYPSLPIGEGRRALVDPTGMPGTAMTAFTVPSAVPEDAFLVPAEGGP
jgi:hypothetical protein